MSPWMKIDTAAVAGDDQVGFRQSLIPPALLAANAASGFRSGFRSLVPVRAGKHEGEV
jgi:hypothetical protein